ncbi:MAG: ferrochelatase [Bosea sp. (in: a-proteobacteria)]
MNAISRPPVPMPEVRLPGDHPPVKAGKVGVLLMNLGTPEGTSYWPMRAYLKEFLSDKRVIETNRFVWWMVLNGIILTIRPKKKGHDYASIWNKERNEGPLKTITRSQTEKLAASMAGLGNGRIVFDWAMRYGFPDVKSRMQALLDQGCERVLIVPLYPQYAAPTSATACDHAFRALMEMRWQPAIRVAPPWHDDPAYVKAVAQSVRDHIATLEQEPEVVLCSFHGMPKSYLMRGDPYHCHCAKTWRLVREELGWPADRFVMTFQSRFGPEEWLKPYTDETVAGLAKRGIKRMAIIAPGFTADCLETLEELDVENREIFLQNGGEQFSYIPCLNDSEGGMDVIRTVVERELMGWV